QVALEVESSRVSLQQAIKRVDLAESSLEKAYENEKKAEERYHEGKVSVVEVIDAQVYRLTSQVNYVQAKVAAQSYLSQLKKATNSYGAH
ncbi:MAG: TolC family protein, partial [Tannerellaceae bacterium]